VAFWYIFPHFGLLCEEKSGNPDAISRWSATELMNSLYLDISVWPTGT
jgi:hypothetical protein